jgi:hypothetical protein
MLFPNYQQTSPYRAPGFVRFSTIATVPFLFLKNVKQAQKVLILLPAIALLLTGQCGTIRDCLS